MYPEVPTAKQTFEFFLVCVRLSNVLLPINAVRLDERTNQIYVLAGEEIEVLIYPNGKVRFL
ncbi:DUF6888 family protein [Nostoc favosum]|jgi:hypothetical protein|uniref:DUF6888 domain-containing protein n=1 Tax=Nostoc favosum CHAB5714 TaxID=2780399 RepID=A0ABS8I2E4_9NOSO|nr:hypothetical protein [Nostoc favosum]MCC5598116.1 hypothetical protein [Nostoc favosum CHAB5714]